MARQVTEIQQEMLDAIAADTVLSASLTSTSKRAIYRLFTFVVAASIAVFEQLLDVFKSDVESIASKASPATGAWLQDQIFKFQYSATNPQTVQLVNFAPAYPTTDTSLRIITRCSVTTNLSNSVLIKVAQGSTPAALSSPQLSSLQAYVDTIGIAGINYQCISLNADKLYCAASIYYNGQYANVIKDNVIAAINQYLAAIPFNGKFLVSDLETKIRNVEGVTDIVTNDLAIRADATLFANATYLVQNKQTVGRLWNTIAGYIVGETTSGKTLSDSLTFIAE